MTTETKAADRTLIARLHEHGKRCVEINSDEARPYLIFEAVGALERIESRALQAERERDALRDDLTEARRLLADWKELFELQIDAGDTDRYVLLKQTEATLTPAPEVDGAGKNYCGAAAGRGE